MGMVVESQPLDGAARAGIEDPAGTLLAGDSNSYYRMAGYTEKYIPNVSGVASRHFGVANILWADGHVNWVETAKLRYARGSKVPGMWTPKAGD